MTGKDKNPIVAYRHSIVWNDPDGEDYALSFKPDSFPLDDVGQFRSVAVEPLVLQSDLSTAQEEIRELRESLKGVIAISDRKHDAYDRAHAALIATA
jgi:hypothetical protein